MEVKNILKNTINQLHPIGEILSSSNASFNPNNELGGTWTELSKTNYGINKWPVTTISSGTVDRSLTITTNGNPVFLLFTGDLNPINAGGWCSFYILKDGVELTRQIAQSYASSNNIPFSLCWLDHPSAGTYTYTSKISWGNGQCQFGESSATQAPEFVAFEIGIPLLGSTWKKTGN